MNEKVNNVKVNSFDLAASKERGKIKLIITQELTGHLQLNISKGNL